MIVTKIHDPHSFSTASFRHSIASSIFQLFLSIFLWICFFKEEISNPTLSFVATLGYILLILNELRLIFLLLLIKLSCVKKKRWEKWGNWVNKKMQMNGRTIRSLISSARLNGKWEHWNEKGIKAGEPLERSKASNCSTLWTKASNSSSNTLCRVPQSGDLGFAIQHLRLRGE